MLFIPISQLKGGMKLAHDVLVFERSNVRLLSKGSVLSQSVIDRLHRFDVSGVYVKDEITGDIMPSEPVVNKKIKTQSLNNLEWTFRNSTETSDRAARQNQKYIKHIDNTVNELSKLVTESKEKSVNISDLKAYDEYTYHHSLSVTVISLAIAMQLGLSAEESHKLGFAAMMHDIGKMRIPIEVLNKPFRLTDEEFEIIKNHSRYGEEYLLENEVIDPDITIPVANHHEKLDGTGYPDNLHEHDIHFFAKIISVADVYDALTSRRPYRNPEIPSQVAEYIMGNCGSSFDMDIVHAFLNKIEFYPIGTFVEFSNGKKAVVIKNHNPLHPIVKMMEPPFEYVDMFRDRAARSLVITRVFEEVPLETIGGV